MSFNLGPGGPSHLAAHAIERRQGLFPAATVTLLRHVLNEDTVKLLERHSQVRRGARARAVAAQRAAAAGVVRGCVRVRVVAAPCARCSPRAHHAPARRSVRCGTTTRPWST